MTKLDPIIAVKDIDISSKWYQRVFGFRRTHGGDEFAVIASQNDEIVLCLHKWGAHEHPTMTDPAITEGNGLILYFRVEDLNRIRQNVKIMGLQVAEELHFNTNSQRQEFSLRDPDDYYLTITEFHVFKG